ncbi:phosphatidylserine decarboxylase-domain-containing protein [Mycena maculata]|uniref:phosphatidylserine decarboxylase n=1 Tax=Mycena maculata TaxID=230809 RepID=A0AAD7NLR8_9AGAR|nr:phosphatidylserine decarboxylase-domain-containing protein [Mycena maculata]
MTYDFGDLHSQLNSGELSHEDARKHLIGLVDASENEHDVSQHIHARSHASGLFSTLVHKVDNLLPGVDKIEKLAAKHHVGNWVVVTRTGPGEDPKLEFEAMPIYARIGMHLLFYGKEEVRVLHMKEVEKLLKEQSIKEGTFYDNPKSVASIPSFIATYKINLDELKKKKIDEYGTFNEFFYRELDLANNPNLRPVDPKVNNELGICSAADCRLTVFPTVEEAQKFWIKGSQFTIPNLLGDSEKASPFNGGSLAIFRLAPADYHRFHSPIDATIGEIVDIPGQYYTVNPQAVNEPGFDVFSANKRSVLYLTHKATGTPVAFVAIGALLVASIAWTNGRKEAGEAVKTVNKGEELGYFAYGGSTVVAVFPPGAVAFDEDLVKYSAGDYPKSEGPIETVVKVGNSLGQFKGATV